MNMREPMYFDQPNDGLADHRPFIRLWAAAMHRGIVDYCDGLNGRPDSHRPPHDRTKRWLYCDKSTGTGSFLWLCDLLKYDPGFIRKQVENNWKHISDIGQKGGRRPGGH